MDAAIRQEVGRPELRWYTDWADLGAEIRRRAAVLTVVHWLSEGADRSEGNGPLIIRLDKEVRP